MEEYKFFRNPTQQQIEFLVTFMEKHPRLASGQLPESYSLHKRERTWEYLKNKLNSIDSPFKTRSEWKKVWNDKKCSVRNKAIMYKRRIKKNPEENNPKFTLIEKRIMKLIGFRQLSEVCPTINSNFHQYNSTKKTTEEQKNSGPKISFSKSLQSSMDNCQLNESMETDSEQPITNGAGMSECITSDVPILGNSPQSLSGESLKTKESTMHENTLENNIKIKKEPSDDILYETSSSSFSDIIKPIIVSVAPVLTSSLSTSHSTESSHSNSTVNASPTKSQSHVIELDPHNLIASTKELQLEDCTEADINLLLNDYIKAKKKENLSQDTSNLRSESSDSNRITPFRRTRQKPLRYRESSSDEEIFIVSEDTGPQSKRKKYIISTPSSSNKNSTEVTETRDFSSPSASSELKSPQGVETFTDDDASLRQMKPISNITPTYQSSNISGLCQSVSPASLQVAMQPVASHNNSCCCAKLEEHTKILEKLLQKVNSIMHKVNSLEDKIEMRKETRYDDEAIQNTLKNFPFSTVEDFVKFDQTLVDSQLYKNLVNTFKYIGGSSARHVVGNILKLALFNSVAEMYSWAGAKQKMAFRNFKFVQGIFEATQLAFPETTQEEVATLVSNWLRHAKQRREREEGMEAKITS